MGDNVIPLRPLKGLSKIGPSHLRIVEDPVLKPTTHAHRAFKPDPMAEEARRRAALVSTRAAQPGTFPPSEKW